MKEISLTMGYRAIVDDEDYEYLDQFKWAACPNGNTVYAHRSRKIDGKKRMIIMHRVVMNCPAGMVIDHIDHNGLNNQKYNLRICTHSQNNKNYKPTINKNSKYKGVTIVKNGKGAGTIKANIRNEGKQYYLGQFKSELDAAHAYDLRAKELHGEFALTNFI